MRYEKWKSDFIINNYGKLPIKLIAKRINKTTKQVREFAYRRGIKEMPDKVVKSGKKKFALNPNEPTQTTITLICRYHFEGDSIKDISLQLGRTEEYIKSVLDECISNGNYERYNKYGRVR